ncbi:hypothetical protein [Flavobacterium sp. JP2137]|uniref:hypothetical protein n=1 Tax=Flavobacterium sp. JP2137 TaxID=3414510 RepID=UPI003D2FF898
MDKPTKKTTRYNAEVINRLREKYGVSTRFITMSITGDRTSETSDRIKADYKKMVLIVENTLNQL